MRDRHFQPQHLREQVSLVIFSQLFSRNTKRRARNASGKQIDRPGEWFTVKLLDISAIDIPLRTILPQTITIIALQLHQGNVFEACLLQS